MMHICAIDYVGESIMAEARTKRGERQLYCGECGAWRWPEECAHGDRLTEEQFRAILHKIDEQVKRKYLSREAQYQADVKKGETA